MSSSDQHNGERRKRLWFDIHSWVGLKLSILTSFILITGTIAVLSYELDWLLNSEMRVPPAPEGTPFAWGEMYDNARAAYPGGQLEMLFQDREPWFAAQGMATGPDGKMRRLWFNPYTGDYQGHTGWYNIQRIFRFAHRHLMLPTAIGIPIVCTFAFLLLASMVSGLVFYKKFWRGFFRKPRFGRDARTWLGDLHRLGALWSSWFLVLIVLTSFWYLAEKSLGAAAPYPLRPAPTADRGVLLPDGFTGADLDRAAAAAEAAYPELAITGVGFPRSPTGSLVFAGQAEAVLVGDGANLVAVDPVTFEVTGLVRGENLSAHQRLSQMADPLHFGTWGGLTTKILWFLFGVVLSGLSVTGMVIYGKRVGKSLQRMPTPQTGEAAA